MSECLHEAIKLVVFIPQSRPFWVFWAQAESVQDHSVAKWEWGPVCRNAPARLRELFQEAADVSTEHKLYLQE